MYYITLGYFSVAVLIFFCFLSSPEELGVKLEDETIVAIDQVVQDDYQRASTGGKIGAMKSSEDRDKSLD